MSVKKSLMAATFAAGVLILAVMIVFVFLNIWTGDQRWGQSATALFMPGALVTALGGVGLGGGFGDV